MSVRRIDRVQGRGGRRRVRGDAGGVTAEFAVALPAVAVILAACVGGLQLAAAQVRLQDAAALAARAAARGEGTDQIRGIAPGAAISTWRSGELLCASASSVAAWSSGLPSMTLSAQSCALDAGR